MLTINIQPIRDAATRKKLWQRLQQSSSEVILHVDASQSIEDALRVRCGSAPEDLVEQVAKLNPDATREVVPVSRQLRFFPCPYWFFGQNGDRPATPVRSGESVEVIARQLMGSTGPVTMKQIKNLNPTLVNDAGKVTGDGKLVLPFISRPVALAAAPESSASSIAKAILQVVPPSNKQVAEESIPSLLPGEYTLVTEVRVTDPLTQCAMPSGNDAWPFDIESLERAVQEMRARIQAPPSTPSVILVADTGIDLQDDQLVGALWRNNSDLAATGNFRDVRYGASMVTRSGNDADIQPPAGSEYSTHGPDIARVIAEAGRRRSFMKGMSVIAVARLNDPKAPFTIGLNSVPTAFNYAKIIRADALSLSVVVGAAADTLQSSLAFADFLVVSAAGNDGRWVDGMQIYPPGLTAGRQNLIVVGAHDWENKLAWFSNLGQWVDILAPGCGIRVKTADGSERTVSGTSFAVPFVSHTAGLLRSAGVPAWPPSRIKFRIVASGRYDPALAYVTKYGVRLDPERAVRWKDDSILLKGAEKPLYGVLDPAQQWTCKLAGNVSRSFRPAGILKIVTRESGSKKPATRVLAPAPDKESAEVQDCPSGFQEGAVLFTPRGAGQQQSYQWEEIADVVPALK